MNSKSLSHSDNRQSGNAFFYEPVAYINAFTATHELLMLKISVATGKEKICF